MNGSALPAFHAAADGKIRRARLVPQPDDTVPRFPYEGHLAALVERRTWPASTERINELRLAVEYERNSGWTAGPGTLAIDIVDYPGEWLLDLALIETDYRDWSRRVIESARHPARLKISARWLQDLGELDPDSPPDEAKAALFQIAAQRVRQRRAGGHFVGARPGVLDGRAAHERPEVGVERAEFLAQGEVGAGV